MNFLMKKLSFLLLLILTACAPALLTVATPVQSSSIQDLRQDFPPSIEAFDASEQCPHICWLGINPGVTTLEQARILLRASDQIDQNNFHVSANGIGTIWFTEKTKTFFSNVGVSSEDGMVQSITFHLYSPFTINDFGSMFGELDEISIRVNRAADAQYVEYIIYYGEKKSRIWVSPGSNTGPQLSDHIQMLVLSTDYRKLSPSWLADYENYRQPWLGFGHFNDYLPGETPPVDSNPTP